MLDKQQMEQHWLIEGLWARLAIGLIGGAPKCCKTWLGLDMAVSVATGTKALGHFETKHPARPWCSSLRTRYRRCALASKPCAGSAFTAIRRMSQDEAGLV